MIIALRRALQLQRHVELIHLLVMQITEVPMEGLGPVAPADSMAE